jgi:hypothetical protein
MAELTAYIEKYPAHLTGGDQQLGLDQQLTSVAVCESADVRDPFLCLRLGCRSGLCRKLQHCCFLIFKQVS